MIDTELVTEAIIATGCSPIALTEGGELVEAWVNEFSTIDAEDEIIAVEVGFSIQIDSLTWIIGVQDLISSDSKGIYGSEWKSTRAPNKYWSEEQWLKEIQDGPQIAVYALALNRGVFYEKGQPFVLRVPTPVRERVRAIVKTAVPIYWPKNPEEGWRQFDNLSLNTVVNAFRSKAEQIRAARRLGLLPWQLPGKQCFAYNRNCEHYADCTKYQSSPILVGFDQEDPAAKLALPFLPEEAKSPDAVVISASSYSDYSRCLELGRRNATGGGKESSLALSVGTVLHSGLSSLYNQLKEYQNAAVEP